MMTMKDYRLLGKTGLRVAPLALGTMNFGKEWGWGIDAPSAHAVIRRYIEAGGNLLDTADLYTQGRSEEIIGQYLADSGQRDHVVLATKYSFSGNPANPNAGGNGRKNLRRALEGSLKRLKTDYIDLYFLHAYDTVTPIEEVMSTLNDLVREGKILHIGLSDVPAWYAARAQTVAELRGWEPVAVLQLEYSLIARSLEREHRPLAQQLGMGIMPWSPLAGGFLTGKFKKNHDQMEGEGRIRTTYRSGNPVQDKFDKERNWQLLHRLRGFAEEIKRTPAEIALNWVVHRPGVTTTLIAASNLSQLESNLSACSFDLPAAVSEALTELSALEANELDLFFQEPLRSFLSGNVRT